ncbi:hypothetical protein ACFQU2_13590 [Siccirubricoccus deserti]
MANDNNLPFSAGRFLTRADANEFILLRVPELLRGADPREAGRPASAAPATACPRDADAAVSDLTRQPRRRCPRS